MKRKLTNAVARDLEHDGPRTLYVHDTTVRGFCLSVTSTGAKSWYFYGRINGRPRRVRIGTFPEITATDARDAAREIIGKVSRGKDVAAARRHGRRTLGELFQFYLEGHAKLKKRTWQRDEREYERFLSKWKRRPISEITRADVGALVTDLMQKHGRGPARKVRALLSKMYSHAIAHDWTDRNPVTGTLRPDFEPRDRYLREDEVEAFLSAVAKLQRQSSRDFILLALFTGARRSNVAEMRWDEIDRNRGVWTIPKEKFKGKREQRIPLMPACLEIIDRRRGERAGDCPWVFPGPGKTGHIVEPKAAMQKVRELSGIDDLRFHDLRRTLGAWQNNAGISLRVIQATLGHANIRTTAAAYTPTDDAPVRAAMGQAVAALLTASNGKGGVR